MSNHRRDVVLGEITSLAAKLGRRVKKVSKSRLGWHVEMLGVDGSITEVGGPTLSMCKEGLVYLLESRNAAKTAP